MFNFLVQRIQSYRLHFDGNLFVLNRAVFECSTDGYPCKGSRKLRPSDYCGCLESVIDFGQKVEQAGQDRNTNVRSPILFIIISNNFSSAQ